MMDEDIRLQTIEDRKAACAEIVRRMDGRDDELAKCISLLARIIAEEQDVDFCG